MRSLLWCILVLALSDPAVKAQSGFDEITLYSSPGQPIAYIAPNDDLTIYLWSGKPVAYLHAEDVYTFNGRHLGWFVKGLVYNHRGQIVGAIRSRLTSVPQISPIKSLKELKPIKGIREISPLRPVLGVSWSEDQTLLSFLLTGDQSHSSREEGCETGHWIDSLTDDGKVIKLENGSMWRVDDADTVTSSIWLPASEVTLCGSKMINADDEESVAVAPLHISKPRAGTRSGRGYLVEAAVDDETFVINGQTFKAKTYCFGLERGDRVLFVEGSPFGACASAKLLNLRNDKICEVWCE